MLPEGDAVREEWEARVARTSAGAGGYMNGSASHHTAAVMGTRWRELVETSDTLRTAMREGSDAAMPESLQRRLLAIPQTRKWWQASAPVRWAGAAVAALLLYYVGEFSWNRYQAYQDRRELTEVASLVVTQHPTPPTPLVESEDEQQVTEVLAKQGMTMPPLMVEYRRGGTHLTGGGVTTFNGEKAYFTLWEWEGRKYTLYQFMPSTFHLRDNFVAHETVVSAPKMPAPPATSPSDYRIWYWSEPDHHCGWAVVSAATSADNPFVW